MKLYHALLIVMVGAALGVGLFSVWDRESLPRQAEPRPAVLRPAAIVEDARAFILPVAPSDYLPIRDFNVVDPVIGARAAILVDNASQKVLFAKDAEKQLPIASITKLMSAMVILDNLNLNDEYRVTAEDLNLDGTGADFIQGERFLGTDLFKIMLMKSSNDAVSVFETTARSQGIELVPLMNEKAKELGMVDTVFSDPAGLNDTETLSTASDVVALLRAAQEYPMITETVTIPEIDIASLDGRVYHVINTNQLLGVIPDVVIGKTGNTVGALGTMALGARVEGDGDELLSVILGSENRFKDTRELIQWGKRAHKWK